MTIVTESFEGELDLELNQRKVSSVYEHLLDAWNNQNARGMADLFADDGEHIVFDGSQSIGQAEIFAHLESSSTTVLLDL